MRQIFAAEVEARDAHCTCCDRWLKPGKKVWLELDQRTNTFHDFGGVPEERSQGWFEFGPACAAKARKTARAKGART